MSDANLHNDISALVIAAKSSDRDRWPAAEWARVGRRLLDAHALLDAIDLLRAGLDRWPDDVGLRQAMALAWSRSASPDAAAELLATLVADGARDAETIGLLAAVRKQLGLAAGSRGRAALRESLSLYEEVYRRERTTWHGVNAATLSLLLGDTVRAHDTAREVIGLCRRQLDLSGDTGDYFLAATMAEASLVLGDLAAVEKWSRRARGFVAGRHGLLGTTRRQFFAVVDHVGLDRRLVDDWLPMPRVVVFAGHMIDRPGREVPRFPADRAAAVAQAIQDWLLRNNAGFGFSSAACGGDILFQEAFAMLRGERCVVLPFPEESFRHTSVERDGPTEWGPRFEAVVTGAMRVVRASRTPLRDESVSYEYANQLILGLARARATELGAALETLVVSDGQSGDGDGGTSAVVSLSRRLGIPVHVVDPRPGREPQVRTLAAEMAPVGGIAGGEPPFGAVLFADAKGFSSLPDAQVPLFTTRFLGCIAALIDRHGSDRFVARETWGDGMFFAFPRLVDAALFALDVTEAVNGTDWVGAGFSFPLLLRTALHYGPMYPVFDPIAQRQGVSGAHIAQAARLEPKTPPGQVYATEAFAARAALENHDAFRCVFVRQLDFDKRFGSFPTYVITRGQASGAPHR